MHFWIFFCDILLDAFWIFSVTLSVYSCLNTMILYVFILSNAESERPRFSRGFPNLATGFFSLVFHPGFSEFIMDGHENRTFSLIRVGIKVVGDF